MSNKVFIGIIAVLVVGVLGSIIIKNRGTPEVPRPGIAQENKGQEHSATGQEPNVGGEPSTSGPHTNHIAWQVYDQEVPDVNLIHNMEHGGVYISYRPDLSPEELAKIKAVFFSPFKTEDFTPNKVILAPRAANDAPIIMSSWLRSMKLDSFDEEKMVEYYRLNVGKSPEPAAS